MTDAVVPIRADPTCKKVFVTIADKKGNVFEVVFTPKKAEIFANEMLLAADVAEKGA